MKVEDPPLILKLEAAEDLSFSLELTFLLGFSLRISPGKKRREKEL